MLNTLIIQVCLFSGRPWFNFWVQWSWCVEKNKSCSVLSSDRKYMISINKAAVWELAHRRSLYHPRNCPCLGVYFNQSSCRCLYRQKQTFSWKHFYKIVKYGYNCFNSVIPKHDPKMVWALPRKCLRLLTIKILYVCSKALYDQANRLAFCLSSKKKTVAQKETRGWRTGTDMK